MPYRNTELHHHCAVCATKTAYACRRCERSLCADHRTEIAFYVPTFECTTAETCERRKPPKPRTKSPGRQPIVFTNFGLRGGLTDGF